MLLALQKYYKTNYWLCLLLLISILFLFLSLFSSWLTIEPGVGFLSGAEITYEYEFTLAGYSSTFNTVVKTHFSYNTECSILKSTTSRLVSPKLLSLCRHVTHAYALMITSLVLTFLVLLFQCGMVAATSRKTVATSTTFRQCGKYGLAVGSVIVMICCGSAVMYYWTISEEMLAGVVGGVAKTRQVGVGLFYALLSWFPLSLVVTGSIWFPISSNFERELGSNIDCLKKEQKIHDNCLSKTMMQGEEEDLDYIPAGSFTRNLSPPHFAPPFAGNNTLPV